VRRGAHNPATLEAVPDLFINCVSVGHNDRVVLGDRQSSSLLDYLGRNARVKTKPHALVRVLSGSLRAEPSGQRLVSGFGVDVGLGGPLVDLC
jgi:hypothetical protein